MISSFDHPALSSLRRGISVAGVDERVAAKLCMFIDLLEAADSPESLKMPGVAVHSYGKLKPVQYGLSVGPRTTLVFNFEPGGFSHLRVEGLE